MNKGYIFRGYLNFMMFCRVNLDKLFLGSDSATILSLKNQVDLFIKSAESTSGGCPCNKNKRRQTAHKVYRETVVILSKSEEIKNRIANLLNGAEEVLFLLGSDNGNPLPKEQDFFIKMQRSADQVRTTAEPTTITSGREPPAPSRPPGPATVGTPYKDYLP